MFVGLSVAIFMAVAGAFLFKFVLNIVLFKMEIIF